MRYIVKVEIEVIAHSQEDAAQKVDRVIQEITPKQIPGLVGVETIGA
jgi:predicted esterase YcpF (UPF0227 family)